MIEAILTANTKKPWENVTKCTSEEDFTHTVIIGMHTNFIRILIQAWFGVFNYYKTLTCCTSCCDCTGRKMFYLCCFIANETRVVFLKFSYANINCIPNVFKLHKLF